METKKYIIEIPDNTAWLQWVKVSDKDGHICFDFKYPEDLTPYIEPDFDAVKKEAYDKGYQDATVKIGSNEQAIAEKAYQRGLNDAWDAARKITSIPTAELHTMFDKAVYYDTVFRDCTAPEALSKLVTYEEQKKQEDADRKEKEEAVIFFIIFSIFIFILCGVSIIID